MEGGRAGDVARQLLVKSGLVVRLANELERTMPGFKIARDRIGTRRFTARDVAILRAALYPSGGPPDTDDPTHPS